MKTNPIVRLTQLSMLAAVSVVLVLLLHFPIFPYVAFLEYDMADVPILLGTLLYGTGPGLLILGIVCVVQAFLAGGNGWVGMIMHFVASGALVLCVGECYRRSTHKGRGLALGLTLGVIARTLLMIPMNLIFTVHVYMVPHDTVVGLLLPGIIPFNLIKGGVNALLTAALFQALKPFLRRYAHIIQPRVPLASKPEKDDQKSRG